MDKGKNQLLKVNDLFFKPFISQKEIGERVRTIGKEIEVAYKDKRPLFIAVLNGAFVFAADLIRAVDIDSEIVFVRVTSYHGLRSTGAVKTIFGLDKDIENRHLIVVEDIVDSGKTMHYFLNDLKEKKPASVALVTLLLKPGALQFPIKPDYVGFEIPTKFVVGYGLDYDGLGRNYSEIYQLDNG